MLCVKQDSMMMVFVTNCPPFPSVLAKTLRNIQCTLNTVDTTMSLASHTWNVSSGKLRKVLPIFCFVRSLQSGSQAEETGNLYSSWFSSLINLLQNGDGNLEFYICQAFYFNFKHPKLISWFSIWCWRLVSLPVSSTRVCCQWHESLYKLRGWFCLPI